VIVVAAGQGRRAGEGELKQFRPVAGVPLLLRAIRPFAAHPGVAQVVVVLPEAAVRAPPGWLAALSGEGLRLTAGGSERIDSVERGLTALDPGLGIVLVHDGARPFPDSGVIDAVIEQARAGRAAVPALPVTDTLKQGAVEPGLGLTVVRRTVPRDDLWRAQTPQGFPRELLTRACKRARAESLVPTDDAAMVEALGETVVLIPDVPGNLKVTVPADFALAEALAERSP
jgi:2-C-methyl-D-erythritol 4-phosphate cytidylyltransferase